MPYLSMDDGWPDDQPPKGPLPTVHPPSSLNDDTDPNKGPSWGLIIPIILIGVFLLSVLLCLWWHNWRHKRRTLHVSRSANAFQRSYRSRSSGGPLDSVRDSTRSTTPLRSSLNEKAMKSARNNLNKNTSTVKVSSVNVIPVAPGRMTNGKYAFQWDNNHWRAYPTQTLSSSGRGTKPLSPINEIDSPSSMKMSELSMQYNIGSKADFSPYHLTWVTPNNPPPMVRPTDPKKPIRVVNNLAPLAQRSRPSSGEITLTPYEGYEPVVNSPFYPNNNTPTTECDTTSEASQNFSQNGSRGGHSSQYTSYPSSPKSTIRSTSQLGLSVSLDTEATQRTSYSTSYHGNRHFELYELISTLSIIFNYI